MRYGTCQRRQTLWKQQFARWQSVSIHRCHLTKTGQHSYNSVSEFQAWFFFFFKLKHFIWSLLLPFFLKEKLRSAFVMFALMCGQPKPTSSDIITTKPRMEVQEASFPLPLMKKRKITEGKARDQRSCVSAHGCVSNQNMPGAISLSIPNVLVPHLTWASGMMSSTTTYTIAPAANASAYGRRGSAKTTAKAPSSPARGSTIPLSWPYLIQI